MAKYRGKDVKLNKPFRLSTAESKRKKFGVYVKNKSTGKINKVTFGARGMSIKRSIPARQRSFLARMGGVLKEVKGQKSLSPAFWSIKAWKKRLSPIMSRILDKLADQHEQRIIDVLYRLEEDVIKEVTRATGGKLVSQRLAIQLQPAIRNLVETTFLDEADTIINEEYNKIAKEVLDTFGKMPIPKKFKSLTEVDLTTLNALKTQSFSGFEDIAERFLKIINDEVYQSTIAGRPFDDMVSNIRSHINGVYKQSNIAEINELVDFINENKFDNAKKAEIEEAVRKLHTQYASDRAGNNLRRYASQIAHDSVMQFHGQFTVAKAKDAGLNHFTYTGTLVRDSRPFCRNMLNKTLTENEIRDIWNNQGWQGKSTGDPFIVRGGYRCRHTWIPTNPDWDI